MTYTVGPKGQVVIPKELRDRFGIEPGDEVDFWCCDDHLAMRPARLSRNPKPLRGRFRGSELVEGLKSERRFERQREARR
ncbi:MAG: AbrB/MazE/SpoVT family DNA-binding domain-containing protein [Acidimicrobiaceae bacterium]|nr:AbrB/MazE/SpoVT family DNA-binding domain-containing protein [Acidimicrobiaceae bacterium]